MQRSFPTAILALLLVLTMSGGAAASTASITPATQTHGHGVAASWTLSWGGVAPFRTVCFYYDKDNTGEGGFCLLETNAVGATASHAFYPCVGRTYTQVLNVTDHNSTFATKTSKATESGGNPC
jgi:hypothetical protein